MPAQASPPPLEIRLFGGLRVERSGLPVAVPAGRARALLAFMLLHPDVAHSREVLADRLWPDVAADRATRQLTDLVYRLRQALGADLLRGDRLTIRMDLPARTRVDIREFERLAAAGDPPSLREAVALYTGELAPELYDDWIAVPRAAAADTYRTALVTLAEGAEANGATVEAFTYFHWLTAADPMDEAGHRGLMRAYLRSGHPAAAIHLFERLAADFRSQLDVEPSPETVALAEAARREAAADEPATIRPFVGRRHDRAAILDRLEAAAAGSAQVVLLEGTAGIGKTRLIEVLADDARWRGFAVAIGRADSAAIGSPHAPLDTALATALSAPLIDRVRRRLSPAALDAAGILLPGLVDRTVAGAGNRPNLAAGLAALLREVEPAKLTLLVLDDVHLAGPAMWDALRFVEYLRDRPLVVILAYRADEVRRNEAAWAALRRLDASAVPLRVRLGGLSLREAGDLAAAFGRRLANDDLEDLQRATDGNPLFLTQELAAQRASRPVGRDFIELLDRRLAALSGAGRKAIEAAAVLGSAFSMGEWLALLQGEPAEGIEDVLESRLVVQLPDRYGLEHDLTREHIYATTPTRRRTDLHRRAAAVLERRRAPAPIVAFHLDRAGQGPAAIAAYRRAAEDAFTRYAYVESLAHVDRALALEPASAELGSLLALRHRLLGLLLRLDEWRVALDAAERFAIETDDRRAMIEVLEGRVALHTLDGDMPAMEAAGARAIALAAEIHDAVAEARVLASFGWHVSESVGDNRRAIPLLRKAARLSGQFGDEATRIAALCALSSAQRSIGRCRAAQASASRAMTLVSSRPHLTAGRAHALAELAETAFELGEWQDALEAMRAAIAAYRELDDPWSFGSSLFGMVNIAGGMGQGDEAVAAGEELVALGRQFGIGESSDFGVWHRVSLGRARLAAGDLDGAAAAIATVANVVPGADRPRMAARWFAGQLALARGDPATAVEPLEDAVRLWELRPEPRDVGPALLLAIAAARAGRDEIATRALHAASGVLAAADNERHAVLAAFARYEVTRAPAALRAATSALARQAARFRDPALRAAFVERVTLHREVASASVRSSDAGASASEAPTASSVVRFTKAGVPLGRRIRDDEWVVVPWERLRGPSDDTTPQADGAVQRRRDLISLVEASRAAGAAPTDDQLAAVLGVSRRTVLRDIRFLERSGTKLATRRRAARPPGSIG